MSRVNVDLKLLVEEVVGDFFDLAATRGLELSVDLPDTAIMVEIDPNRVRQILGNLVSNAVKYTDHGSVLVRAGLSQEAGKVHALVGVIDTGPGIPADQQERIFEEFTRLEPGLAQGAGVGLSISRRLARAMGGDITVQSEIGRGSTFTLLLPATQNDIRTDGTVQAA